MSVFHAWTNTVSPLASTTRCAFLRPFCRVSVEGLQPLDDLGYIAVVHPRRETRALDIEPLAQDVR